MEKIITTIPEVFLFKPKIYRDDRGFFYESFNLKLMNLDISFVQENHSFSKHGVLRGLHYQIKNIQDKLVRVIRGKVFDVAVDLRRNSPYFGKWVGEILSDENKLSFFIPKGFAHGFYVLSDYVDFTYLCSDYYNPSSERGIIWNDPTIGIKWPLLSPPTLSKADANYPLLMQSLANDLPNVYN